jgi:hypothetical protein
MRVGRRGVQATAMAAVVGVALLVSACGGSNSAAPPSTRARPTTTDAPVTSTNADLISAAVLAAYRSSWSAFEHAAADANATDPQLAATMIDPQLQGVKANLLADQRQGIVGRGTFALHPKIMALTATTATVVDCAYSTAELVYASTGKAVPPVTPPENDGVQSALVLTGGSWKVSKQTVTDGKCAPGS